MLYEEAVAELNSYVPNLGPALARNLVNRAWQRVRDERRWTFLKKETAIYTPALINVGSVTFTQGSTSAVGDAAAAAAWIAAGGNTILSQRQIRLGLGPVYNITSFDGVVTITLEQAFGEPTVTGATYQIQQFYYAAPSDFLRWESVVDPISAFAFLLDWTKEELDRADPQRGAQTLPHRVVGYRQHPTTKLYLYELWPTPSAAWRLPALYQVRGVDMTDGDEFPTIIPSNLIMASVKMCAYEWAEANKGNHEALNKTNWLNLYKTIHEEYIKVLRDTKRQDEEIYIQDIAKNYMFPAYNMIQFGANYWQSHAPYMIY